MDYVNSLLPGKQLVLLYRMSRDGLKYVDFHSRCDNKGPTLSLFKTDTGRRCGGYTNVSWDTSGGWKHDSGSWLMSLDS